jgi:diguanylate cyclase (GGDEF)-like protein
LNLELENKQKELSEANARLEQLAITDQITEIYNRHYFFQVSQHFWEEARRYRLPLVIILMDIDNFKSVNDRHGHLFGDYVLKEASRRMRKTTRKSDILARFGGEELIVLASNTDILTGQVLAERLRISFGSEPFVMGNSSAVVTISVGISGTELADFPTFDALLDSSDQALYGAKRAGKNCVYTYAGPLVHEPRG